MWQNGEVENDLIVPSAEDVDKENTLFIFALALIFLQYKVIWTEIPNCVQQAFSVYMRPLASFPLLDYCNYLINLGLLWK